MKKLLVITILVFLAASCEEEQQTVIEGRYMFTTSMDGMFQLFVEDNYTGTSYRYLEDLYHELPADYEAESYIIQVDEDTAFTDSETGNSYTLDEIDFPFHWPNQKLEVRVNEEAAPFSRRMNQPITSESRLLPVYTAANIIYHPYGYDEFLEVHTPIEENHYMLFLFDESFSREYVYLLDRYAEEIAETYDTYLDIHYFNPDYFGEFMEIDAEPAYVFLTSEGEVMRTGEWEQVAQYFEENTELHLPNEGDPFWYEILIGH